MSHRDDVRDVLDRLARGELDVDRALERLTHLPYEDLGFAKVDHHRGLRTGLLEACDGWRKVLGGKAKKRAPSDD